MLVLTRKVGEEIVINNDIIITLVSCSNGRVRVGVKAPQHVSVDRGEIHERKTQFFDIEVNEESSFGSIGSKFAQLMAKSEAYEEWDLQPLKSR